MNLAQAVENSLKLGLSMEWYGIRIEDTKEIGEITYHYVSVPESSTIEVQDQGLNAKIKTAKGLASLAKDMLVNMQIEACKVLDDHEDWIQYVKDNMSDFLKVYAKVRKGEVWTKGMGDARIKELKAEIKQASGYKEV